MKKEITKIIIVIIISLGTGLIIGQTQNYNRLKAYQKYEKAVETVLDECWEIYDLGDTVCEGDNYQDYIEAKENL
jgi:uncharacterized protein YxeA